MSTHRCWVYGDNVNTDVIFPGKYTYTLKTPEDIAAHALEDLDPTFASGVQVGDAIVAGSNWGMGSSREQGVTSIKYSGVSIIIAASFSGLYFRNCINQGVLPIVCPGLNAVVKSGDSLEIDLASASITAAGQTFNFPRLSPSVQAIMDAGGLLPMLQKKFG
ncbi:MAG: 3-isopropylmalate dehydratase [Chloroflexi bacterium]|nr:3-isopropylmalate dehydratase [Chloroflexota bacterium]MCC6894177.1 3-isopropylmalate dehydratase [Anaerolineae bacterium]